MATTTHPPTNLQTPSVTQEDPGYGRSIVKWLGPCVVSVFALAGGGMFLGGASNPEALGVGLMAALWGGAGFAVMLGGVFHANSLEGSTPTPQPAPAPAPAPKMTHQEWPSATATPVS